MDEERSASSQLQAMFMEELGPLMFAYADALRAENPAWAFGEIVEQTRRCISDCLDDVMSGLVEAVAWRLGQDGGDVYDRYVEELSTGATLYQSDKVAPIVPASLDEWRERRIQWWWSTEVVTAASRWHKLDEPLKQMFLDGLVDQISFSLRGNAEQRALAERIQLLGVSGERAKRTLLLQAAVFVLARFDDQQFHRFGVKWVTGADGKKQPIIPRDLQWFDGWTWFQDEVRSAAMANLLERPYPAAETKDALDSNSGERPDPLPPDALLSGHEDDDPLLALLADEEEAEQAAGQKERLNRVLARATPRQRELLRLIAQGHTTASAARTLGIAEGTAYAQLNRLRKAM